MRPVICRMHCPPEENNSPAWQRIPSLANPAGDCRWSFLRQPFYFEADSHRCNGARRRHSCLRNPVRVRQKASFPSRLIWVQPVAPWDVPAAGRSLDLFPKGQADRKLPVIRIPIPAPPGVPHDSIRKTLRRPTGPPDRCGLLHRALLPVQPLAKPLRYLVP